VLGGEQLETAAHATPVVFVHGLLGDPSNFLVLRTFLSRLGIRSFASFSYAPRLDYQTMAPRLGEMIERVCRETGSPRVDVVGHSLGGLIARYLVELGDGSRVRRLVTLGSPYYSDRRPLREHAVFAANDVFVTVPATAGRRVVIVRDCGHWNLLRHAEVLRAVGRVLRPTTTLAPHTPAAREAA
jgi:pimeloyl-ACP methyl ester carboxylesterase